MHNEASILENLLPNKPKKNKAYHIITALCLLFICLAVFQFTVDVGNIINARELPGFLLFMLFPVLGFFFHLRCKRAGWILNTFFYCCLASVLLVSFITHLIMVYKYPGYSLNWKILLLLLLTLAMLLLLCTGKVRQLFGIHLFVLITSVTLSIVLAALFIYFMYHQ